jgi:hypothetical protein
MTFANHVGRFDVREGKLIVEPADHFARKADARGVIEPFLRAWEIQADIDFNIGTIRFKFMRADVVDRDPPPPGSPHRSASRRSQKTQPFSLSA